MISYAKKITEVVLVALVAVLLSATCAFASEVTVSPASGSNAYRAIQDELDNARQTATAGNPAVITVKPGNYALSTALRIYSNTKLVLNGVTLTRTTQTNVIRTGDIGDNAAGYAYRNISIVGGTLNGAGGDSTVLKIGHAQNVQLSGVTLQNTRNAHLMEVAGVNGLSVKKCTFKDQVQTSGATTQTPEAIQLDILVKRHFSNFRPEDLPIKNVTVDGCLFQRVPRGVGSHTAVLNNPITNVKITNNTFTGIAGTAIQCLNYVNCTISGNTINAAPRGIAVYSCFEKGVFLSSTPATEGGIPSSTKTGYVTPLKNQNITITNNKITVKGKDTLFGYENDGIFVAGLDAPKGLAKNGARDALPKGNYYLSGAKVTNNTISTIGHGIRFRDVFNSTIQGNKITFSGSSSSKALFYGIELLQKSTSDTVTKNTITGFPCTGILLVTDCKSANITSNKISNVGKYGIGLQNSEASTIKGNTIANTRDTGIFMKTSKVGTLSGNKISNAKGYGISIAAKSSVTTMSKNALTKVKSPGIVVKPDSKVKKQSANKTK